MDGAATFPEDKVWTIEERTRVGLALYADTANKHFKFAREVSVGEGDAELRMAIYYAINDDNFIDDSDPVKAIELLNAEYINVSLMDIKRQARQHIVAMSKQQMGGHLVDSMLLGMLMRGVEPEEPLFMQRDRLQQQAKAQSANARAAFNAQHKPAPEGTVKELAAKYGKSLSEIRRLKAAGELHTLENSNGPD